MTEPTLSPAAVKVLAELRRRGPAEAHELAGAAGDEAIATILEELRAAGQAHQVASGLWLPGPPLRAPGRAH